MTTSVENKLLRVSGIDLDSIMGNLHTWEGTINAEW